MQTLRVDILGMHGNGKDKELTRSWVHLSVQVEHYPMVFILHTTSRIQEASAVQAETQKREGSSPARGQSHLLRTETHLSTEIHLST